MLSIEEKQQDIHQDQQISSCMQTCVTSRKVLYQADCVVGATLELGISTWVDIWSCLLGVEVEMEAFKDGIGDQRGHAVHPCGDPPREGTLSLHAPQTCCLHR